MSWTGQKILAAVGLASAFALGGCAYDDYGYGGVSVGTGYYAGNGYYDDYGGYGPGGYGGWYNNFYYPGSGYYIYDRGGSRHRWDDGQRRYWESRRQARGNDGRGEGRPGNWNNGQGRPGNDRGQWRGNNQNGRPDRGQWQGGRRGAQATPNAGNAVPQAQPQPQPGASGSRWQQRQQGAGQAPTMRQDGGNRGNRGNRGSGRRDRSN